MMAHAVGEPIGQRPKQQPDTTPIVGREAELERLQQAVNLARMRQLQVVELVGEPGIGKSRLVQELRTLALGFQQLDGAAEHYSASQPFAAVRAPLRQLVGITPDRTAAEAGAMLAAVRRRHDARPRAVAAAARDPLRRGGRRRRRRRPRSTRRPAATSCTGRSRRSSSGS